MKVKCDVELVLVVKFILCSFWRPSEQWVNAMNGVANNRRLPYSDDAINFTWNYQPSSHDVGSLN